MVWWDICPVGLLNSKNCDTIVLELLPPSFKRWGVDINLSTERPMDGSGICVQDAQIQKGKNNTCPAVAVD